MSKDSVSLPLLFPGVGGTFFSPSPFIHAALEQVLNHPPGTHRCQVHQEPQQAAAGREWSRSQHSQRPVVTFSSKASPSTAHEQTARRSTPSCCSTTPSRALDQSYLDPSSLSQPPGTHSRANAQLSASRVCHIGMCESQGGKVFYI